MPRHGNGVGRCDEISNAYPAGKMAVPNAYFCQSCTCLFHKGNVPNQTNGPEEELFRRVYGSRCGEMRLEGVRVRKRKFYRFRRLSIALESTWRRLSREWFSLRPRGIFARRDHASLTEERAKEKGGETSGGGLNKITQMWFKRDLGKPSRERGEERIARERNAIFPRKEGKVNKQLERRRRKALGIKAQQALFLF